MSTWLIIALLASAGVALLLLGICIGALLAIQDDVGLLQRAVKSNHDSLVWLDADVKKLLAALPKPPAVKKRKVS